jgi:hypothetical protein
MIESTRFENNGALNFSFKFPALLLTKHGEIHSDFFDVFPRGIRLSHNFVADGGFLLRETPGLWSEVESRQDIALSNNIYVRPDADNDQLLFKP